MQKILSILLVLLLLSVESSLQTSIIWDRSGAWSLWLYKIGIFSIADIILIILSLYVILSYLLGRKPILRDAKYPYLCVFSFVYLFVGLIYNLSIYAFWKTFLYDCKVLMCISVPYFFLSVLRGQRSRYVEWFTPVKVFFMLAVAGLIDLVIVKIYGQIEYPRFLGIPIFPVILPIFASLIAYVYSWTVRQKVVFAVIFLIDIIEALNRLAIGFLYNNFVGIAYYFVISRKIKFIYKYFAVIIVFFSVFGFSVLAVYNPFGIINLKSKGALTRQIQFENVIENFRYNFPIFFGKGLGSTWYEYVPVPRADIYSVGTSMSADRAEAMEFPVKFIFNFGPAATLYKWGVLGTFTILFLATYFFQNIFLKMEWMRTRGFYDLANYSYLKGSLFVSFIFIVLNFTYFGILKNAMVTSMLAFYVENRVREDSQRFLRQQ